ncbi:hypothetical protein ACT691_02040 [Vibrio metschnikovii]
MLRSAHPYGCQQAVLQQIHYVKSAPSISQGPKRVLILRRFIRLGSPLALPLTLVVQTPIPSVFH